MRKRNPYMGFAQFQQRMELDKLRAMRGEVVNPELVDMGRVSPKEAAHYVLLKHTISLINKLQPKF